MNGLIMKKHWLLTVTLLLTALTAWSMSLLSPELRQRKEVLMGISNGVITAPINPDEVYKLLGVGKYNGWYDIGYICSDEHEKTNKYAKYKPEIIDTPKDVTEDQRRSNMYGFSVPKISTSNLNTDAVWEYKPPVAGINWCRLNDFIGYDASAVVPIAIFFPSKLYSDSLASNEVYFDIDADLGDLSGAGNVLIKDIFYHYQNWYPGVIAYNRSNGQAIWKTTEHTLADFQNGEAVEVPLLPVWTNGQIIEMYAMLSQYNYTGSPAETPPLDHEAYYLQYEAGKGHASAEISPRYTVVEYIKVDGFPVFTFFKTLYNDEYHWRIIEMQVTLNNEAPTVMDIKVHPYIEVEDTADVYEFPVQTTSIPLNGKTTVYSDTDIYIPAKFEEVFVNIQVQNALSSGYGGNIFYKYYNFATNTWRDA